MSVVHILTNLRKGLSTRIVENLTDKAGLRAMFSVDVQMAGHEAGKEDGKMTAIPGEQKGAASLTRVFPIAGPVDVRRVSEEAIFQVVPENNSLGYSKDYMPYIEFHEEDFPWRYTPLPASEELPPWLMLLACKEGEFKVSSDSNGNKRVEIQLDDPEEAKSFFPDKGSFHKLAHVQITTPGELNFGISELKSYLETNPDIGISRLFCSRKLEPETWYTMFLVPAFELGRLAGLEEAFSAEVGVETLSWEEGTTAKTFPIYHQWTFATGKESFMTLAEKQNFITAAEFAALPAALKADISDTGLRRYRESNPSTDDKTPIDIPSALVKTGFSESNLKREPAVMDTELKVDLLLKSPTFRDEEQEDASHPVYEDPWIVPPVYGARHILAKPGDLDKDSLFLKDLNLRFSNRAAAGMGAQVVKKNQEMFMNRAWGMVEEINALNQRVREFYQVLKTNGAADAKTTALRYYDFPTSVLGLQTDAAIRIANAQSAGDINAVDLANDISGKKLNVMTSAMGDYTPSSGVSMDELSEIVDLSNWESVKSDIVKKGEFYQLLSGKVDFYDVVDARFSLDRITLGVWHPSIQFVQDGDKVKTVVTPVTDKGVLVFHSAFFSKDSLPYYSYLGYPESDKLLCWLDDTSLYTYTYKYNYSLQSLNTTLSNAIKEYEKRWGPNSNVDYSDFLPVNALFGSLNTETKSFSAIFQGADESYGRFIKQSVYNELYPDYPKGFAFELMSGETKRKYFFFPADKMYEEGARYYRVYFGSDLKTPGAVALSRDNKFFQPTSDTALSPAFNNNFLLVNRALPDQVLKSRSAVVIMTLSENWGPRTFPDIGEMSPSNHEWKSTDSLRMGYSISLPNPTYCLYTYKANFIVVSFIDSNQILLYGHYQKSPSKDNKAVLKEGATSISIENWYYDADNNKCPYCWYDENGVPKINLTKLRELIMASASKLRAVNKFFWRPNAVCFDSMPAVPVLRADDLAGVKGLNDAVKKLDRFYESIVAQVDELKQSLLSEKWAITLNELADESKKATPSAAVTIDADQINRDRLVELAQELSRRKMTMDLMESNFDGKYPVMAAPLFPDPTSFYLRELSEKYVLPSVEELKPNSISCFQSNPAFEEAFLAGMNTEMGRELLWREYPTDERGSCFRKFWDQNELPSDFAKGYFDVKYLHQWKGRLGENHESGKGKMVVFVIKSELMVMYPNTSLCLAVSKTAQGMGEYLESVLDPVMTGWLSNDTFMAGFDVAKLPKTDGIFLAFVETDKSQRFFRDLSSKQVSSSGSRGPKVADDVSADFAVNRFDSGSVWGVQVDPKYLKI